jgi:phage-related protein
MFSGRDFFGGRMISIIFNVFGNANGSAQENYNILQSVLLPQTSGTTPLYFLLPPNPTQFINARVRALNATVDANYTYGFITAQVQFFCPNPLYFSNNEQTATMAYLPPTGRTYNRVYNLVYDPASIQITTTVTNNGWTNTYPTITLNGPIENPIIGNNTQNAYLEFAGTYTSSDLLVIDLYNKLVTLNGLPARNLLVSGTWFSASPGNNEYYLEGDFGSTLIGTTKAVVTWNSAYV